MPKKQYKPEEIVTKLRQVGVGCGKVRNDTLSADGPLSTSS